jgi:hypothetical protein
MERRIMDAKSIAHEIRSGLENCMSDLAGGDEILADDNWNDPDVLGDLLGDRIFDACNCLRTDDDKILAWEVADWIMKISHTALEDTARLFKERQGFI